MKRTKAKRKLLSMTTFNEVLKRKAMGVPVARIMVDLDLKDKISRTSLVNLITAYDAITDPGSPHNVKDSMQSLYPEWLQTDIDVQEQPDNWYYEGYFPWGTWKHD